VVYFNDAPHSHQQSLAVLAKQANDIESIELRTQIVNASRHNLTTTGIESNSLQLKHSRSLGHSVLIQPYQWHIIGTQCTDTTLPITEIRCILATNSDLTRKH